MEGNHLDVGQLLAVFLSGLRHRSSRAYTEEGGQEEETDLAPGGLSAALLQARTLALGGGAGNGELLSCTWSWRAQGRVPA